MSTEQASSVSSIRRKLGRGLGSLISSPVQVQIPAPVDPVRRDSGASGTNPAAPNAQQGGADVIRGENEISMLRLDRIHPNPRQPRQHFDDEAIRALANSIRVSGVMQPIMVRVIRAEKASSVGLDQAVGRFELIAGERRWRAAQLAGLTHIPAVVRNLDDRTAAEFSLVENLQREDLNPMERASAFQRLIDEFGLTHIEIADRVGLDRSNISNHLRLNDLDDFTKDAVRADRLSMGHAKVLLAIANMPQRAALAARAVREAWSVRELDRQATAGGTAGEPAGTTAAPAAPLPVGGRKATPHLSDLQRRLSEHLGTKVEIKPGRTKGAGKLVINFYSFDEFEGLMKRIEFMSA